MERPPALTGARRAFTIVAAAAAICAASTASASAGWGRPTEIFSAPSIEVLGPQIAFSPAGIASVSFNEQNVDAQASAGARLSMSSAAGAFPFARVVPGVQEVLALAFSGSTLELLTATSPRGQSCCTTVQVIRDRAGAGSGRPQTIVRAVGGAALGRLVPLAGDRLLAVIAGPNGLWVTEARGADRFAAPRVLTPSGVAPVALAVAATAAGRSTVVWTQGAGQSLLSATGAPGRAPSRPRTALTVPPGHQIDGVQLVPRPRGLTVGWTESWNDAGGTFHSQVMAADLAVSAKLIRARQLSAPGDVASELSLAADPRGDQVAAWNVCSSGLCAIHARIRRARGGWFGAAARLGRVDAGDGPQVAMASDREALVGWLRNKRVVLAELRPGARRFGATSPISGGLADNLDLEFGPTGAAVATWTQGTFPSDVFAAAANP